MDKMDKYGMDLEKVNIERLKEIFPECVTDGKVNFDALRTILGDDVETSGEKYSFNWVGKSDAMKIALMPSTGTLRPCKDKSKDWDKTENLYIEGDNLEVLKTLEKTYHNQIKMIYIDPPYNTGKDFVYHDDFHDNVSNYLENSDQAFRTNPETAGRFHTDWLNMMYPRLKIAREMLKEEGVVFISIDDGEITNLRKICDEVFGEYNFIGQITVVGNPRGRDYGGIARMHDYILAYQKTSETCLNLIEDENNEFKMFDDLGGFELRELRNRNIKFNKENRPNLYYPFYIDPNNADKYGLHPISLTAQEGFIELYPLESQGVNTVWRWGKAKAIENLNINIMAKPMQSGGYMIVEKYRESKTMARSVWWDKNTNTEKGSLLIKELMDGKVFDYPKPVEMIMRLCEMGTDSQGENIVLDFFSGSATTAHAVMRLNAEDGGNRKFIMVQLPEVCGEQSEAYKAGYKTICDIGEERIRRAGAKIKEALGENGLAVSMLANGVKNKKEIKNDEGETVAQLSMTGMFDAPENVEEVNEEMANNIDVGFKVFKLDSTNIKPWDATVKYDETTLYDLQDSVVKEDRSNLDIAYEVMLKYGIFNMPLEEKEVNGKTVYSVGEGYMIISLNDEIATEDVAAIAALGPKAVVFKESGFVNDNAKMNADYTFKRLGIDNVKCI